MPSTPRADAIRIARSHEACPVRPHTSDGGEGKIDHFGHLGMVMQRGTERLLADTAALSALAEAASVRKLDIAFSNLVHDAMLAAFVDPKHRDITAVLRDSQHARIDAGQAVWRTVETSILAGSTTFAETASGLYGLLSKLHGTEAASHPASAVMLDKISKMNIEHFGAYKFTYINDAADGHPIVNLEDFAEQIEPALKGGFAFKPGYPLAARVPTKVLLRPGILESLSKLQEGEQVPLSAHIPLSLTIGCPISFDPKQGRELWRAYAEARTKVEMRAALSNVALSSQGDTEELL